MYYKLIITCLFAMLAHIVSSADDRVGAERKADTRNEDVIGAERTPQQKPIGRECDRGLTKQLRIRSIEVNGIQRKYHYPDEFHLDYDETAITFWLDHTPGTKVMYRFEGNKTEWLTNADAPSDTVQHISFGNLADGRHMLLIKQIDTKGRTIGKPLHIGFIVNAAPWTSNGAIGFYIILLAMAISWAIRLWIRWKVQEQRVRLSDEEKDLQKQHLNFMANISHEIRTPLTLISAPLKELVENNHFNEHDRELLAIMQRSMARMNQLTEQILDTSNSKNDSQLKLEEGNIGAFVKGIVDNFSFYAREKGLTIRYDGMEVPNGTFDKEKIEKIISNLINNAIKYTPEGGDIIVRLARQEDRVSITVKDTGIGIQGSKQRDMFRRFNRMDITKLQPKTEGFGVGLHYAQCLAFLHRGTLTYEPNVPNGSRFILSIPYKASPAVSDDKDNRLQKDGIDVLDGKNSDGVVQNSSYPDSEAPVILLVEDNYEMRTYIQMLLEEDYNIITAVDGVEALEKLKLNVPDLVLTDVVMTQKDGYELCRDIKASDDYGHLPVLILTAKGAMADRKQGIDCGADAYMAKPFDPYYLKSVVANLLENRKRIQRLLGNLTTSNIHQALKEEEERTSETLLSERDRHFLEQLHKQIEAHISDESFTVQMLAKELLVSYSSLYAKTKDMTGQTPQQFLATYRMNVAMQMLKEGEHTVTEVCYHVGSSSPANFTRSFKKHFGMSPSSVGQ